MPGQVLVYLRFAISLAPQKRGLFGLCARAQTVNMTDLTWREAELLAGEHMRSLGLDDVSVTQPTNDQGIDISSPDGVAQVKHHLKPVGSPDIQRLRGAAHQKRYALFYALSGYTTQAIRVADETGIALFQYDVDGHYWAINNVAIELSESGASPIYVGMGTRAREQFLQNFADYAQSTIDLATVAQEDFIFAGQSMADNPESVTESQREALVKVLEIQDDVYAIVDRMGSGVQLEIGEALSQVARIETYASLVAEVAGLDLKDLAIRARQMTDQSDFVPSATQVDV